MSFMYNPYPYDDPRAINKPVLAPQTIESVTAGTPQAAVRLAREFAETLKAMPQRNLIVAFDGYTTADWTRTINLLSQQLGLLGIGFEAMDFARVYKTEEQIHEMVDPIFGMGSHERPDATLRPDLPRRIRSDVRPC